MAQAQQIRSIILQNHESTWIVNQKLFEIKYISGHGRRRPWFPCCALSLSLFCRAHEVVTRFVSLDTIHHVIGTNHSMPVTHELAYIVLFPLQLRNQKRKRLKNRCLVSVRGIGPGSLYLSFCSVLRKNYLSLFIIQRAVFYVELLFYLEEPKVTQPNPD